MRIIAVEEKDIKILMEKLEFENLKLQNNVISPFSIGEVHRRFHFIVCSWVQEHGSNYPGR